MVMRHRYHFPDASEVRPLPFLLWLYWQDQLCLDAVIGMGNSSKEALEFRRGRLPPQALVQLLNCHDLIIRQQKPYHPSIPRQMVLLLLTNDFKQRHQELLIRKSRFRHQS